MKSPVISPIFEKNVEKIRFASIQISSPYPNAKASFNWLNVDFPYPHTHNHWEIFIITKGKLKHTLNGHQEVGSKGYACLIRPTDYHQLEYVGKEEETHHINFTFSNEMAEKLFSFYKECPINLQGDAPLHFFMESAFIDSIINQALIAQTASKQTYEQYSLLMVHQLITIMFSQNLNVNNAYPDWLNDFLFFLHTPECFSCSMIELANHSPYSYSRLSRLFKQYTQKTLIEYVNELRIVYAKRTLRTTQKSILEISFEIGYESVSSFNHNFKQATDLTPSQYRKKYTNFKG